jgi:CheY-like chemotaxis protein
MKQIGNEMVLTVADNGIGIALDFLPSIFDPFTRADEPLTRSQGGLGVGLAIVKRIVAMHGGIVNATSAGLGQGSEFTIRLPVIDASAEEARRAEQDAAREEAKFRVLVVDDNIDAADSMAMLLRFLGHEVQVAYGGKAAIEAARTSRPDAILLDIGLPDIDGYEVASSLKRDPAVAAVPIVAVTGHGRETDRAQAQQAGFDAYLVKPADPGRLAELLTSFKRSMAG